MRCILSAWVVLVLLASTLTAQGLSLDDFVWTFSGPPTSSGFVTADVLHVTGPSGGFCSNELAIFTTTAPFTGTILAHLKWDIQDICHFDWPIYVVNGQYVKIPITGDLSCFLSGLHELQFDVQAGDVFGLGVGSSDCVEGPGIADFTEFSLVPPAWIDVGGALDPRIELEIAAPPESTAFGSTLAAIGDLDGDGLAEIAIGASESATFLQTVDVRNGEDGALLWSTSGASGSVPVLVATGDVNGDGLPDLATGNSGHSSVRMLSGADGSELWTWSWSGSPFDGYGSGLAAHADVDGDGVLDVAVGAAVSPSLPVRVLSGASGAEFALILPGPGDEGFGRALGSPGDLDGDGASELMVAALGSPHRVRVYSGSTGVQLFELHPPGTWITPWISTVLVGAGDWDGDGVPDMAIGAPADYADPPFGGKGSVSIFSGATGSLLSWLLAPGGSSGFGAALAGGLDVDGDGVPDLAIGAPDTTIYPESEAGRVRILRSPDGALLQEIVGAPMAGLGQALAWQAGAPTPTLAVGLPATGDSGRVRLYSELLHVSGAPELSMSGLSISGLPWTVSVTHGLPGNLALLVAGLSAPAVAFKGGVLVPAADLVVPVVLDAAGVFEHSAVAPAGITPALTLWLQAWMPDPAGPKGWSATRAQMSPPP